VDNAHLPLYIFTFLPKKVKGINELRKINTFKFLNKRRFLKKTE